MIISCNNCNKKFVIDSSVIPEKGRLLQCSSCNYKWFFRKKVIKEHIKPSKNDNPSEMIKPFEKKLDAEEIQVSKTIELLETQIKDGFSVKKNLVDSNEDENRDVDFKVYPSKKKKNYNILSLIILFIITFIAFITVMDTFKSPIGKIVPNIEFLLYNLYETINDIKLFLTNLI